MLNTQFKRFFLLLGLSLTLAGCGADEVTIEKRQLPKQNPTSYVFDASLDTVKDAINQARGEKWRDEQNVYERSDLAWKGDGNPFASRVFAQRGNENDAYLSGMGNAVGASLVYIKGGKELTYYADFHIHLASLGASKTRVDVFTYDSHVKAGTEWHPFARAGIFVIVDPTSIEEYRILLDIGKALGEKDMPKLITPDTHSPTRKIKVNRRR